MRDDATALAADIRKGVFTSSETMEAAIAAASDASFGAVSWLNPALGRSAARYFDTLPADAPQRAAPFAGVPTLVKDLGGPFAGLPVVAGSRMFARADAASDLADSDLADRFRTAGLMPFGLTTSPEFGLSLASEPAIGPVARNPLDPALSPGGSSGGAAAAVASGIVAIAHATDAGGSIRVPAACCGLIGLKPGRGTVPGGPGFGNHLGGIASEFALCRSVRDAEALFPCVAGNARGPFPPPAFAPLPKGALRIGLLTDTGPDTPTDPTRAEAVEAAALAFEAQGHRIVRLSHALFAPLIAASDRAFQDIVAVNLAELVATLSLDAALAEPLTQAVISRGQTMPATALWSAETALPKLAHALWRLFDAFDVLLTPMLTSAPRPLGWLPMTCTDTEAHFSAMAGFAPLATLANASGFPALSMPFGADEAGLPLPIQIIAPMGTEPLLLALARQLESEGRWSHPFPVERPAR